MSSEDLEALTWYCEKALPFSFWREGSYRAGSWPLPEGFWRDGRCRIFGVTPNEAEDTTHGTDDTTHGTDAAGNSSSSSSSAVWGSGIGGPPSPVPQAAADGPESASGARSDSTGQAPGADNRNTCCVCLADHDELGDALLRLDCGHRFHSRCLSLVGCQDVSSEALVVQDSPSDDPTASLGRRVCPLCHTLPTPVPQTPYGKKLCEEDFLVYLADYHRERIKILDGRLWEVEEAMCKNEQAVAEEAEELSGDPSARPTTTEEVGSPRTGLAGRGPCLPKDPVRAERLKQFRAMIIEKRADHRALVMKAISLSRNRQPRMPCPGRITRLEDPEFGPSSADPDHVFRGWCEIAFPDGEVVIYQERLFTFCHICIGDYQFQDVLYKLSPCGHLFHAECLSAHLFSELGGAFCPKCASCSICRRIPRGNGRSERDVDKLPLVRVVRTWPLGLNFADEDGVFDVLSELGGMVWEGGKLSWDDVMAIMAEFSVAGTSRGEARDLTEKDRDNWAAVLAMWRRRRIARGQPMPLVTTEFSEEVDRNLPFGEMSESDSDIVVRRLLYRLPQALRRFDHFSTCELICTTCKAKMESFHEDHIDVFDLKHGGAVIRDGNRTTIFFPNVFQKNDQENVFVSPEMCLCHAFHSCRRTVS